MKGNFLISIKECKKKEVEVLSELVQRNEYIQKEYFAIKANDSDFKLNIEKSKISFLQSILTINI
jgi:hypothetical protein